MGEENQKSTEIEVFDGGGYAVLQQDINSLRESFAANLGDEDNINEFDFDRISVPAGGGIAWTVPTFDGEPEVMQELVGIPILIGPRRVFYRLPFEETGGGSPPDCSSFDAKQGFGRLSEDESLSTKRVCKHCPKSQWGSKNPDKKEDNAQACDERRLVFLLREQDMLPIVVNLPPTSIGPLKKFMIRLTSRAIPCWSAVVGFRLSVEKSAAGIDHSVLLPRLLSRLAPEPASQMRAVADALRPYFTSMQAERQQDEEV